MNNQQRKNLAILFALVILISLIYALSMVRIQENKSCLAPIKVHTENIDTEPTP